jgi:hypothetical protein
MENDYMEVISRVDWDFWWNVAQKCNYATFFHTPVWQKLATASNPSFEDVTIGFRLENGTQAVFPLLKIRGLGPLQDLVSSFKLCYGGIIADGPLSQADVDQIYKEVTSWPTLRLQIIQNPFADIYKPNIDFEEELMFTRVMNLNNSFDDIFANFSSSHRANYRRGLKKGVIVETAESLDQYKRYYNAFRDSIRRWESSGKNILESSWDLFEKGFYISREFPDLMKLWIASVNDNIIAGAWVFYWNQHAVYWHGATLEDYFDYRPSNVLHTEIIKDAIANNFTCYDFNPSGDYGGVAEFKRRFGTTELPVSWYKYGDQMFNTARRVTDIVRKIR